VPAIFEFSHVVMPEEIDGLGHVGNVHYVRWLQEAAIAHSAAQGWPTQRYHDLQAGWVVRSHQIEYLQPAFQGERIVIRTWVANLKKIRSLRRYQIARPSDGTILAVAATDWVFISYDKRIPKRVPDEVRDAFEIVDEP